MQVRKRSRRAVSILGTILLTFLAGTSTSFAEQINAPSAVETNAVEATAEHWEKFEIDDYDDNLSTICYEIADPEETSADKAEPAKRSYTPEGNAERAVAINLETTTTTTTQPTETTVTTSIVEPLTQGGNATMALPSTASQTTVNAAQGSFIIRTYGFGHGVGLSQNGANALANYGGYNYQQILAHYYPGTTLVNTGTAETEMITIDGVTGDVLTLISQVVYNEMSSCMNAEAMKAQAVAAYTYCKYNGGGRDMILKANPPQNVVDAVRSVLGQALMYNGSYALTVFCASSGGATASCKDVFTQDLPYLRSVPCEYDELVDPHYGTATVWSAASMRSRIQSAYGITLSGDPNNWFQIIEGDGGYNAYVVIDNQITVQGNALRSVLGLKSPKFRFEYVQ